MRRKVVAALMAMTMCVSMLAGCGNQGSGTSSENQESSAGATTDSNAGAGDESSAGSSQVSDNGNEESSQPAAADELVQTWPDGQVVKWLVRDLGLTDGNTRYNEIKLIDKIEEDLNIKLEFEVYGREGDDAVLSRLTASDLPDLISWQWNEFYHDKGGIPGMYRDGICIELNDLIETSIPNLKAIFEEYPAVARDMINDDGQYLFFQKINPLATPEDIMSKTNYGLVLRQDWLDNVNMSVPTTIDEWYEVLTAFKTQDPNGNGEFDEIPYDASAAGIGLFQAAFGMKEAQYVDPDTGKVEYGARTQKYKAYLEEMNKWYSEGLIGNVYTETGEWVTYADGSDTTIIADLAGSWKGLANADKTWTEQLREKNPNAALVAAPWIKAENGELYSDASLSYTTREAILVTTDCECLDAVAAVVNWMYDPKNSEYMTWGEEGVTFEYAEDGTRYLTEKGLGKDVLSYGAEIPAYKIYADNASYFPCNGCADVDLAAQAEWYVNASKTWADANFDLAYPAGIALSAEQAEKVSADSNTELFEYIGEMKWKFITGQEPLSNFDTYVSNLERMGISDIVAVYQEAYDKYMAR